MLRRSEGLLHAAPPLVNPCRAFPSPSSERRLSIGTGLPGLDGRVERVKTWREKPSDAAHEVVAAVPGSFINHPLRRVGREQGSAAFALNNCLNRSPIAHR